jgi:hypothetical protein
MHGKFRVLSIQKYIDGMATEFLAASVMAN